MSGSDHKLDLILFRPAFKYPTGEPPSWNSNLVMLYWQYLFRMFVTLSLKRPSVNWAGQRSSANNDEWTYKGPLAFWSSSLFFALRPPKGNECLEKTVGQGEGQYFMLWWSCCISFVVLMRTERTVSQSTPPPPPFLFNVNTVRLYEMIFKIFL